jgi:hypothetical protein
MKIEMASPNGPKKKPRANPIPPLPFGLRIAKQTPPHRAENINRGIANSLLTMSFLTEGW